MADAIAVGANRQPAKTHRGRRTDIKTDPVMKEKTRDTPKHTHVHQKDPYTPKFKNSRIQDLDRDDENHPDFPTTYY